MHVSIDVSGLYTNIPQDKGLEAFGEALEEKDNFKVPGDLKNLFEFNSEVFLQIIRKSMGNKLCKPIHGKENVSEDHRFS